MLVNLHLRDPKIVFSWSVYIHQRKMRALDSRVIFTAFSEFPQLTYWSRLRPWKI